MVGAFLRSWGTGKFQPSPPPIIWLTSPGPSFEDRQTLSVGYGAAGSARLGCPPVAARDRDRDLEIAAAFGARVRELRLTAGLTQEQLAEAADLHPTFISNIERGHRVATIVTMVRVAGGLKVDPSELTVGLK